MLMDDKRCVATDDLPDCMPARTRHATKKSVDAIKRERKTLNLCGEKNLVAWAALEIFQEEHLRTVEFYRFLMRECVSLRLLF